MNTKEIISLILLIVMIVGMFYGLNQYLTQQSLMIELYKNATTACEMDNFTDICKACAYGLSGVLYR